MEVVRNKEKEIIEDLRPIVILEPGKLPQVIDTMEAILVESDCNIYVQNERIVKISNTGSDNKIKRESNSLSLVSENSNHLAEIITKKARCLKYDSRSNSHKEVDCSRRYSDGILSRGGDSTFRPLTGLLQSPSLRIDGTIIDKPGYDKESGLYLTPSIPDDYRSPPPIVDRKSAETALNILMDTGLEFPFVSDSDKSAYISGIITALVRRSLPAAPLIAITSSTPGSGKSTLGDVIAIIATGKRSPVLSQGSDQNETDKRLSSALMSGDQIIMIDNIEKPLHGDLLCQATTQPQLRLRPLGSPNLLTVPTNSLLMANGNNLYVKGDMRRRVKVIRLDPQMERPEQRKFNKEILKYVKKHRGALIKAALSLPLAYKAAGYPNVNVPTYGGFSEWERWCRFPLIWLGLPDPLLASESLRELDPDMQNQRQLFAAWYELFKSERLTANQAIHRGNNDLQEIFQIVTADHTSSRRLGNWLKRHKGKIVDGLKLESDMDTHKKVQQWYIDKCGVCV